MKQYLKYKQRRYVEVNDGVLWVDMHDYSTVLQRVIKKIIIITTDSIRCTSLCYINNCVYFLDIEDQVHQSI